MLTMALPVAKRSAGSDDVAALVSVGITRPTPAPPERGEEGRGRSEEGDRAGVAPAPVGRLDDGERQRTDRRREEGGAAQVGRGGALRLTPLAEDARGRDEQCDPDRHVDEEHEL